MFRAYFFFYPLATLTAFEVPLAGWLLSRRKPIFHLLHTLRRTDSETVILTTLKGSSVNPLDISSVNGLFLRGPVTITIESETILTGLSYFLSPTYHFTGINLCSCETVAENTFLAVRNTILR